MKYTNIFEKLLCLFNLSKMNSNALIFLAFIVIFLFFLTLKKMSNRRFFIFSFIVYIGFLSYTIIGYSKELGLVWESIVDDFFTNLYFPSVYTYLFVLIMIDIVTFVSFMKSNAKRVYQWIHGIFFLLIQFVFVFVLELISKNKIDIFSKTSLFSNKDLVMLLELSMNLFLLWLGAIGFAYFTNLISEKIMLSHQKKTITEEVNIDNLTSYQPLNSVSVSVNNDEILSNQKVEDNEASPIYASTPVVEEKEAYITTMEEPVPNYSIVSDNLSFEDNTIAEPTTEVLVDDSIDTVSNENISYQEQVNFNELLPQQQNLVIPTIATNINEQVLNNEVNTTTYDVESEKNYYSLNDYRLFNKILKEIKEHNHNNTVYIDKDLEYRLITKYSTETYHMFKKMLSIYSN